MTFEPIDCGEGVTFELDDPVPLEAACNGSPYRLYCFAFKDSTKSIVSETGYLSEILEFIPTKEQVMAHFAHWKAELPKTLKRMARENKAAEAQMRKEEEARARVKAWPKREEFHFPGLTITETTTVAEILAWWDEMTVIWDGEDRKAQQVAEAADAEAKTLKGKRTPEAKQRKLELKLQVEEAAARADAAQCFATEVLQHAQEEFEPRAEALAATYGWTEPLYELWGCLERPWIEEHSDKTMAEIVRLFYAPPEPEPIALITGTQMDFAF